MALPAEILAEMRSLVLVARSRKILEHEVRQLMRQVRLYSKV